MGSGRTVNDMRLGDLDALLDKFLRSYTEQEKVGNFQFVACEIKQGFADMVDDAPTIDAVPVVHGRWIEKPFLLGTSNFCSVCDSFYGMPHGKFNYCPSCGARMDGDSNG